MVKKLKKGLPKFLLLIVLSAIIFTGLIGAITFQNIFPTTTPYITSDSTVNLSYGIHAGDGLSSITHSWNNTNTTLDLTGLLGWCNFENLSALSENDTQVNCWSTYGDKIGTITGGSNITLVTGKYGNSYNFSGNEAYINTSIIYNFSKNNFSVSFWANKYNFSTGIIVANSFAGQRRFELGYINTTAFRIYSYDGVTERSTNAVSNIIYGDWYFVTAVFDFSSTQRLYINGVLEASTTLSNSVTGFDGLKPIMIGARTDGTTFSSNIIDEVMIFNRSLSQGEITYLYNSNVQKYNSSYYILNSSKTTSIYAQSSFICASNLTGFETCSATNTIQQGFKVNVNFSNPIGNIHNSFYGINDQYNFLGSVRNIETGSSGTLNGNSDLDWYRNIYSNSGMDNVLIREHLPWVYSNSTNGNVNFTGNITKHINEVIWASSNGYKVYLRIDGMPTFLANSTSWCYSDNSTCPPNNVSYYNSIVLDLINRITLNGTYNNNVRIVLGNEPYGSSFLINLSNDNIIKGTEFVKLYNSTYDAIKLVYPDLEVGFGSDYYLAPNLRSTILSNLTVSTGVSKWDFYNTHLYQNFNDFGTFTTQLLANCSLYNANCSDIIYGEWNVGDEWVKNTSDYGGTDYSWYGKFLTESYLSALNSYPSNLSLIMFDFAQPYQYNNTADYPEYPQKWSMVSEPQIDNNFAMSYNVTKSFAHLCPSGGNVWQHENDGECVKWTVCSKGSMFSIIGSNSCNYSQNYTANLSLTNGSVFYPYTSITNYETGSSIPVSTEGIIQLGVLDSYEVLYLTSGDEDGASQTNFFKFNEATGTRVYDLLQNVTYGTISGATWINDSIFKTLTSAIDYTISTSGLLVVSSSYLFNYMNASWSYLATWRDTGSTASLVMVDSLGNSTTFLSILIVISFAVVILTLFKPSVNTNPLGKPHY